MGRKQLALLFFCSLVLWTVANGSLPLLPVYATRLGASPTATGFFLAFSYLALTAGTLGAGWLSDDRLRSRKGLLVAAGLAAVPVTWLVGQAANVWQLALLTAALYLLLGVALTSTSVLTGLSAGSTVRGRVFGVLGLASPLGMLVGSLASGAIADRWGYPAMFAAFSLLLVLVPLASLLLRDKPAAGPVAGEQPADSPQPGLGAGFYLLLAASLAAYIAYFVSVLGRSLAMDRLGFSATAIASTAALGGAIALPLAPVAGSMSDRLGRKPFLALAYLAGAAGLLLFAHSSALWHFWLAFSLMRVQGTVNTSVGNALVTDLVPRPSLGRGIALFAGTAWIGGVTGFAVTGRAVQNLGLAATFAGAAVLPLASALLVLRVRTLGGWPATEGGGL